MKKVFVAKIIRHKLCMIYAFLDFFVQKSFLTKNYFPTAEINSTARGPMYTCLVFEVARSYQDFDANNISLSISALATLSTTLEPKNCQFLDIFLAFRFGTNLWLRKMTFENYNFILVYVFSQ